MTTYASFWQRVKAFALDYLIILGYLIAITLLFLITDRLTGWVQWLFASRMRAQATIILLLTLPVALYFAISESSVRQATWGKLRLGLMVTDQSRNQIHVWRACARAVLKLVPWEIAHTLIWELRFSSGVGPVIITYGFVLVYVLVGLNVVSLIMTKTHQALYDFLAGTYVIKSSL